MIRFLALSAATLVGSAAVAAALIVARFQWLTRDGCLKACPCCSTPTSDDQDDEDLFSFSVLDEADARRLGLL